MGHVNYTPAVPGDVRTVVPYNDAYQAVVTRSSTLESDNLAEQGLTREEMNYTQQAIQFNLNDVGRTSTASTASAWTTTGLVVNATTLRYTNGWTLADGERLLVRSRVHFESTLGGGGGPGIPAAGVFEARIGYKLDAAAQTFVASSRRPLGVQSNVNGAHGTVKNVHLFVGPLTFDWIQIEYLSSATTFPAIAFFRGVRYWR